MHLNASQERLGYSYTPPSTSASAHPAHTTRSPTMPFDGVSGVWTKPRPAADSHPRNNAIATANGDASTTRRSPSRDRDRTRTRTTSASSDQRPNLIRTTSGGAISGSSSSSSVLGGKQPSLTNLRRKTSGDAQMQAQMGILPSSRKGSGDSVSGSGGLGRSESLQRKTSGGILRAPTSASVSGHGPPRKSSLGSGNPAIRTAASSPAHSRNPSLTTPLVIPVYNPPMTMATSSHSSATSHSYSAHSLPSGSGSGLLPPVPPPPPLQHPIRKGSDERLIIPMGPVPKSFVPPPPPPPLPLLLAGKGPPPLPPPSQSLPPTPPSPSPNQNLPTLKMSAALLARRDALAGGAAAYTNSPAPLSDVSTPSSAKSAPPGSGFSWRYSTDASDSPMTGLTTPATSWDSGGGRDKSVYAGSPLASATVFGALPSPGPQGKRERRRLQLHSPIDIAALSPDAESGPLTPPIHSHPIGDESEEGGGPDSAVSEKPRGWLAALEGQVGEEEMEGVLLSPPTFAARKLDPDEMDDIGLDALDLYDDGVDDVDEGADRGRRGRSPSPIRYARRASVDHDMIFSDSSDEDEYGMSDPLGDTVSFDSPAPSLDNVSNSHNNNSDAKSIFNDARSTFSRARSTRSRRKWRNTRVAPPPVPLGSASGMGMNGDGKRKQRARSADSSIIGFGGEAMAPSEMWRKEQAAAKAATQPTGEMRFVYQASQARLPASVPPPPPMMMMNMGNSMGSLQQYDSASVSGHGHAGGSSESGGGGRYYQTSPSVSKNSLPLPLPPKKEPSSGGGLKLLSSRKDKEEKKEKKEREKREKAFRKSAFASSSHGSSSSAQNSASGSGGPHHRSSFSLLRGSTTANSSAEALMGRTPGRVSESSAGSDERERERERNNKFARRPTLFGGVYDRR
ncbi:hypothetical protein C8F01DRAFT_1167053 [Mycena amicta]|nr:hypothetical protein C8F01DRAFT_1167053 [Mycena amicta]